MKAVMICIVVVVEGFQSANVIQQRRRQLVTPPAANIVGELLRNPAAVAGLAISLIFLNPVVVVPPGTVGVVTRLGDVSMLGPGLNVIPPLISRTTIFSTKTRLLEQSNFVPTSEGLTVELDTAILYRVEATEAGRIYETVGEDFQQVLIEPELASAVRALTSQAEAAALYTSGRGEIQNKLQTELETTLRDRGIHVEQVLLKAVKLPEEVTASIELKAKAEQDAGRMQFILQKEQQEAQRKAIEAKGIADFQKIVTDGISPRLLRWKGIEATEKLAESPNSKIIVIGNSKDGLPVILGGVDSSKVAD